MGVGVERRFRSVDLLADGCLQRLARHLGHDPRPNLTGRRVDERHDGRQMGVPATRAATSTGGTTRAGLALLMLVWWLAADVCLIRDNGALHHADQWVALHGLTYALSQ